jgi:cytochrome c553
MSKRSSLAVLATAAAAALAASSTFAQHHDAHAGSGKVERLHAQCVGCHGLPGYKTAFPYVYHVPRIAGQQPGYIVSALKAYKAGSRSHPSMRGIAASLTEEDMDILAKYYGEAKP